MNKRNLIQVLSAAALLAASGASHAGESVTARLVTGVGEWIAAQGNDALRDLREDVERELAERLQPVLPAQLQPESAPASDKVERATVRQISV